MKGRVERILFWLAVAAGTLWAYGRIHTYATGQDPRTYLVMAKGLLAGNGTGGLVVPGWPLVLAGVMRVFGVHAAFWTNVPLFALSVVFSASTARRVFEACKHKRAYRVLEPVLGVLALVLCIACLVSSTYNPFLYFRF